MKCDKCRPLVYWNEKGDGVSEIELCQLHAAAPVLVNELLADTVLLKNLKQAVFLRMGESAWHDAIQHRITSNELVIRKAESE